MSAPPAAPWQRGRWHNVVDHVLFLPLQERVLGLLVDLNVEIKQLYPAEKRRSIW
jgi:hypothetical protein